MDTRNPLLQRLDELADDHERAEQGGGASIELHEAADAIRDLVGACKSAVTSGDCRGLSAVLAKYEP
jgi:hypothetical protein